MEKHKLKREISKLEHKLRTLKFKKSSIELNKLLCEQKPFDDKGGLGFSKDKDKTSIRQDKFIMFVKEANKPIITNSMLNQHIENLRYNESSLNAFAKPFIPQNSFTHNNTPHDFEEISNGEHDRGLSSNLISVSQLNNDDCEAKFTKVDCTISRKGVVLAKRVRSNNLYTCKIGDYSNQHI